MSNVKVSALATEFKMDTKAVIVALTQGGLRAKRSDSSVDADAARRVLGGGTTPAATPTNGNVVSIEKARKPQPEKQAVTPAPKAAGPKPGKVGSPEWYSKYPHVVQGSVREPNAEDKKLLGAKCHGMVCTIKCVDTGEERVINTQDAFQVKRSVKAQREFMKQRRSERRAAKRKRKEAKNA